jgi:hypothetical protein
MATVASVEEPSLKVTLPVGEPEDAVTVAVRVVGCPRTAGFADDTSVVVVEAGMTSTKGLREVAVPQTLRVGKSQEVVTFWFVPFTT